MASNQGKDRLLSCLPIFRHSPLPLYTSQIRSISQQNSQFSIIYLSKTPYGERNWRNERNHQITMSILSCRNHCLTLSLSNHNPDARIPTGDEKKNISCMSVYCTVLYLCFLCFTSALFCSAFLFFLANNPLRCLIFHTPSPHSFPSFRFPSRTCSLEHMH